MSMWVPCRCHSKDWHEGGCVAAEIGVPESIQGPKPWFTACGTLALQALVAGDPVEAESGAGPQWCKMHLLAAQEVPSATPCTRDFVRVLELAVRVTESLVHVLAVHVRDDIVAVRDVDAELALKLQGPVAILGSVAP